MHCFCFSLFFAGISILLLLVMPSSSRDITIKVIADRAIIKKSLFIGKTNEISIIVDENCNVHDLKKKIWEKLNNEISQGIVNEFGKQPKLTLEYPYEIADKVLLDNDTVNVGFQESKATVHLYFDKFEIHVEYEMEKVEKLTFWVKKTDKIETLKEKIERVNIIKPQQKILKYGNEVLQDNETMEKYKIGEGATIELVLEFEIWVEYKKWVEEEKKEEKVKEEKKKEKVKEEKKKEKVKGEKKEEKVKGGKKAAEFKTLKVWAKKKDTVKSLKQKVEKLTEIESERQTLRRVEFGAKLEDNATMAFLYHSREYIYMSIDQFQIHVKDDGYMYTVWVTSLDTVYSLKENIQYTLKVPSLIKSEAYSYISPEEQTLKKHDDDGTAVGVVRLNDSETMAFYGIGAGATVQLSLAKHKLLVKYKKMEFILWVKKTDTVTTVKEIIKEVTKLEPNRQTLRIIDSFRVLDTEIMAPIIEKPEIICMTIDEFQIYAEYEGKEYMLWVKGTETVALLKEIITEILFRSKNDAQKYIYEPKQQTLEYGTFGVLDDRKLMNYYGIGASATVSYSVGTFTIRLTYERKKGWPYQTIWMRKSDTVKIFKRRIEIELGFKPVIQSLSYIQKKIQYPLLDDDSKTMEDHEINSGTIVKLVFSEFEICVFNGGKELRILMKIDDTVKKLKEKIKDIVGIPSGKQKISIAKEGEANRVLQDSEDMLSIVEDRDVIVHVSGGPANQFQIFVQYGRKKAAITVYGTDMVADLKKEIKQKTGIVPERQTLTKTVLEDGKQIENLGIEPNSTIYLS